MVKNEVQEQYMRTTFIQATKSLLKGEGLRGVSARAIASQAGYSYATLYNYFRDIKELIFECVQDFQGEIREQTAADTLNLEPGIPRIKGISQSFLQYFVQYPGIFELLYIEKTGDLGHQRATLDLISGFFDELCAADWAHAVANSDLTAEAVDEKRLLLHHALPGLLLWYLNRKHPDNYSDFQNQVSALLTAILD
jgi:AcrR family transcriptional regulator